MNTQSKSNFVMNANTSGTAPERNPLSIKCWPNPVLNEPCKVVRRYDDTLKTNVRNMTLKMLAHEGVGLAAPQVGITKRMFVAVISFETEPVVFINPKITKTEGDPIKTVEGCLSIPGINAALKCRAPVVTIKAKTPEGKPFEYVLSDEDAVVVQHEIDHLDGITLFDRMGRMQRKMRVKKYLKNMAKLNAAITKLREKNTTK